MKGFFRVSMGALVILLALGILIANFIPICGGGTGPAMRTACASNLRQLMVLSTRYSAAHKGEWPGAKGQAFWVALAKTTPPILSEEDFEVLLCPVLEDPQRGVSHFRASKVPYSALKPTDPLAADRVGNHGDGESINVLLKNGDVVEARPGEALWKLCDEKLSP